MNNLFWVVSLLARELGRSREAPQSLIQLAVDLIRRSIRVDAKWTERRLSKRAGRLVYLEALSVDRVIGRREELVCTFPMRSSAVQDSFVREFMWLAKDPEDTSGTGRGNSSLLRCPRHFSFDGNVERGPGTGYYVCGMDQQSRCSYFAWADQLESAGHERCTPNCSLTTLSEQVWTLLGTSPSEGTSPLHVQLCEFLSRSWKGESPVQGPSVKGAAGGT
jgi:hypothetical protein